jgi:predicted phosphodiesterase
MSGMVLAHVSDIHFRTMAGGDAWDTNLPLRTALERDLQSLTEKLGSFRAILATGDVGFSGQHDEYEDAGAWLAKLTELVGCLAQDVWVVPGNHDVDRSKVEASELIREFHRELRGCSRTSIGALLQQRLVEDEAAGSAYLSPLDAYVAFATPYQCDVAARRPWWECGLPFGGVDNSSPALRIRGLTSVLVSDSLDDQGVNRPMLGPAQVSVFPLPNTVTMTLCHHPPSWLKDEEDVVESLTPAAEIQLWGHVHRQALRAIDGNVHLYAGAVHPSRGEMDWDPRYNVLVLGPPDSEGIASLEIYPRVWRRQTGKFGPDYNTLEGRESERHTLSLHYRTVRSTAESGTETEGEAKNMPLRMSPSGDPRRRLGFRYGTLPYQRRLAIARDLGLIGEDVRISTDRELFELVLAEAVVRDRLRDLWEATESAHGVSPNPNPFA